MFQNLTDTEIKKVLVDGKNLMNELGAIGLPIPAENGYLRIDIRGYEDYLVSIQPALFEELGKLNQIIEQKGKKLNELKSGYNDKHSLEDVLKEQDPVVNYSLQIFCSLAQRVLLNEIYDKNKKAEDEEIIDESLDWVKVYADDPEALETLKQSLAEQGKTLEDLAAEQAGNSEKSNNRYGERTLSLYVLRLCNSDGSKRPEILQECVDDFWSIMMPYTVIHPCTNLNKSKSKTWEDYGRYIMDIAANRVKNKLNRSIAYTQVKESGHTVTYEDLLCFTSLRGRVIDFENINPSTDPWVKQYVQDHPDKKFLFQDGSPQFDCWNPDLMNAFFDYHNYMCMQEPNEKNKMGNNSKRCVKLKQRKEYYTELFRASLIYKGKKADLDKCDHLAVDEYKKFETQQAQNRYYDEVQDNICYREIFIPNYKQACDKENAFLYVKFLDYVEEGIDNGELDDIPTHNAKSAYVSQRLMEDYQSVIGFAIREIGAQTFQIICNRIKNSASEFAMESGIPYQDVLMHICDSTSVREGLKKEGFDLYAYEADLMGKNQSHDMDRAS